MDTGRQESSTNDSTIQRSVFTLHSLHFSFPPSAPSSFSTQPSEPQSPLAEYNAETLPRNRRANSPCPIPLRSASLLALSRTDAVSVPARDRSLPAAQPRSEPAPVPPRAGSQNNSNSQPASG